MMHIAHVKNKLKKILREADNMVRTGSTLEESSIYVIQGVQDLIKRLENELKETSEKPPANKVVTDTIDMYH